MAGDDEVQYKKVKVDELESITAYVDNSRYVLMDWFDQNPDTLVPAGLVVAIARSLTSSIHASHSNLLRPYHDAQWQQQFGNHRNYPVQQSGQRPSAEAGGLE